MNVTNCTNTDNMADVFKQSLIFTIPIAITVIGLVILVLGFLFFQSKKKMLFHT